jgi:hypothetical protein
MVTICNGLQLCQFHWVDLYSLIVKHVTFRNTKMSKYVPSVMKKWSIFM